MAKTPSDRILVDGLQADDVRVVPSTHEARGKQRRPLLGNGTRHGAALERQCSLETRAQKSCSRNHASIEYCYKVNNKHNGTNRRVVVALLQALSLAVRKGPEGERSLVWDDDVKITEN